MGFNHCRFVIGQVERNYPLCLMDNVGRNRVGVVVGCLRKLQRWNLTSIFEEYRQACISRRDAPATASLHLFHPPVDNCRIQDRPRGALLPRPLTQVRRAPPRPPARRRYAGSKVRIQNEQFIELFDIELVTVDRRPSWL